MNSLNEAHSKIQSAIKNMDEAMEYLLEQPVQVFGMTSERYHLVKRARSYLVKANEILYTSSAK